MTGLERLDGRGLKNETCRDGSLLVNDVPSTIVCMVRRNHVLAECSVRSEKADLEKDVPLLGFPGSLARPINRGTPSEARGPKVRSVSGDYRPSKDQ